MRYHHPSEEAVSISSLCVLLSFFCRRCRRHELILCVVSLRSRFLLVASFLTERASSHVCLPIYKPTCFFGGRRPVTSSLSLYRCLVGRAFIHHQRRKNEDHPPPLPFWLATVTLARFIDNVKCQSKHTKQKSAIEKAKQNTPKTLKRLLRSFCGSLSLFLLLVRTSVASSTSPSSSSSSSSLFEILQTTPTNDCYAVCTGLPLLSRVTPPVV